MKLRTTSMKHWLQRATTSSRSMNKFAAVDDSILPVKQSRQQQHVRTNSEPIVPQHYLDNNSVLVNNSNSNAAKMTDKQNKILPMYGLKFFHHNYQTVNVPHDETATTLVDSILASIDATKLLIKSNGAAFDSKKLESFQNEILQLGKILDQIRTIFTGKYANNTDMSIEHFNFEFRGFFLVLLHYFNDAKNVLQAKNTNKFRIVHDKALFFHVACKFAIMLAQDKAKSTSNSPFSDTIKIDDFEEFKTVNTVPFLEDVGTQVRFKCL